MIGWLNRTESKRRLLRVSVGCHTILWEDNHTLYLGNELLNLAGNRASVCAVNHISAAIICIRSRVIDSNLPLPIRHLCNWNQLNRFEEMSSANWWHFEREIFKIFRLFLLNCVELCYSSAEMTNFWNWKPIIWSSFQQKKH